VPTPGENDRGARRIITGQGGEFYYTDDHYASFRAVLR
jgi:ribonuclease T1